MSKKPDNVVFNEDTNTYDAHLKPYATNLSAPIIETVDTISWKKQNIYAANNQFNTVFEELKASYELLMEEYQYNEIIYGAKFNFEPIVGQVYHLYKRETEEFFLSILAPNECNFIYVGSFQLNSDKIWKQQKITNNND